MNWLAASFVRLAASAAVMCCCCGYSRSRSLLLLTNMRNQPKPRRLQPHRLQHRRPPQSRLRHPPPRPNPTPNRSDRTSLADLTAAQQKALAPLAPEWDQMGPARKRKWLAIGNKFASMSPAEQQRVQKRMNEWMQLTPQQRRVAWIPIRAQKNSIKTRNRRAGNSISNCRKSKKRSWQRPRSTSASPRYRR